MSPAVREDDRAQAEKHSDNTTDRAQSAMGSGDVLPLPTTRVTGAPRPPQFQSQVLALASARRRRIADLPSQPTDIGSRTLPPAPLESLPRPIRQYVEEAAEAYSSSPELILPMVLGVLAGSLGARREIVLKPQWREPSVLWLAVVAQPGERKSPVMSEVKAPLRAWNRRARAEFKRAMVGWKARRLQARQSKEAFEEERPTLPRISVDDTTIEALAPLLRDNTGGLVLLADELTSFIGGMNQYKGGQGSDRSRYLSLWSSTDMTIDRVSLGGEPIVVEHPCVSVMGGIQPDMLGTFRRPDGRNDGMVDRWLMVVPPRRVSVFETDSMDPRTLAEYADIVNGLLGLQQQVAEDGFTKEPVPLGLTPDGRKAFASAHDAHMARLASNSVPPGMEGGWSKLPGYAGRLALTLHMVRYIINDAKSETVDAVSVEMGWQLVRWFAEHMSVARGMVSQTDEDRAVNAMVAWLQRHDGTATMHQIVTNGAAGIKDNSDCLAVMGALQARGLVAETIERPATGGRTVRRYQLLADMSGTADAADHAA